MWRKLLLVVLLFGIGYLIWRRMQSSSEAMPALPLTPPASPPPAPVMPPPPPPAASPAPNPGPRPVATRVHRGEPPKTPPASAPASSDTPSTPRPIATRVHRGAPPERRSPAGAERAAAARNGASETVAPPPAEATPSEPVAATDATLAITQDVTTPAVATPEPAPATPETPVAAAPASEAAATVTVAETAAPAPAETPAVAAEPAPSHEEESVAAALATAATTGIEPIDINRAGREALIALPGIGPVLADRIIAYREANGPFKSVDDLIAIPGIGERNINTLRKLVYVAHD